MQLNILDIIVIVIILLSTIFGFFKGSLKIMLGIISQIGSFFTAYKYHYFIGKVISNYVSSKIIVNIFSIVITYFVSLIIFSLLNAAIIKLFDKYYKTSTDKVLGAGLGLARGVIISYAMILTLLIFGSDSYLKAIDTEDLILKTQLNECPNWMNEGYFAQKFHSLSFKIVAFLPNNLIKAKYKDSTNNELKDISDSKDKFDEDEYLLMEEGE